MLISHSSKFKKSHKQKIRLRSRSARRQEPAFGTFAIRAKESIRFAEWHYETVQKVFKRQFKKTGLLWFKGNPNIPISSKPVNIRMGKGKGATQFWSHMAPTGVILAEGFAPNTSAIVRVVKT